MCSQRTHDQHRQPDTRPHDGQNLVPVFQGQELLRKKDLYWEHGDQQALISGDWKLVRRRLGKKNPTTKLFNLVKDPGETNNLATEKPEILERLLNISKNSRFPSLVFPNSGLDLP